MRTVYHLTVIAMLACLTFACRAPIRPHVFFQPNPEGQPIYKVEISTTGFSTGYITNEQLMAAFYKNADAWCKSLGYAHYDIVNEPKPRIAIYYVDQFGQPIPGDRNPPPLSRVGGGIKYVDGVIKCTDQSAPTAH